MLSIASVPKEFCPAGNLEPALEKVYYFHRTSARLKGHRKVSEYISVLPHFMGDMKKGT
jgi:hypothetical protein